MRRIVITLAVAALVLAGCGKDKESTSSGAPPVSLSGTTNNHGSKTATGTMEVELDDFYFGPTFVKATPGQRITLELKNEGKSTHTFTSPGLGNVDEQLAPGASKTITVTAPQAGNVTYFCRFHQGQGMQGAVYVG